MREHFWVLYDFAEVWRFNKHIILPSKSIFSALSVYSPLYPDLFWAHLGLLPKVCDLRRLVSEWRRPAGWLAAALAAAPPPAQVALCSCTLQCTSSAQSGSREASVEGAALKEPQKVIYFSIFNLLLLLISRDGEKSFLRGVGLKSHRRFRFAAFIWLMAGMVAGPVECKAEEKVKKSF